MSYEVQEIDAGAAGVFTYDIPALRATLAVMFNQHANSAGKFKVKAYPEGQKKNAEPDLYCEMNDDDPWKAKNARDDKPVGEGLKVYFFMSTKNPPTLELDFATVKSED